MKDIKIAVIGLGYVGLPLARLFSTKYNVVGYDINKKRLGELIIGMDSTNEVDNDLLKASIENKSISFTSDIDDIFDCNVYIIAVPTPVDEKYNPDLSPLVGASESVAKVLKKNDVVIYESTTFPGCTEDVCVPVLEQKSGLEYNKDFFVGYSPERINPGDKEHTVEKIKKVVSGSNNETADFIDRLYNSVLVNGTYKASSIKVAEASKIIENTQRDLNIAFFNEMSKLFNAMEIDTKDVIEAASTKWNFIKMSPGLVGGHCISVDPYYLIQKAEELNVVLNTVKNARYTNETMCDYVTNRIIYHMNKRGILVKDSTILIVGATFKENCPDTRNTKVVKLYKTLKEYTDNIEIADCCCDLINTSRLFGTEILSHLPYKKYDVIILAVPHIEFMKTNYLGMLTDKGFVYDLKSVLPKNENIIKL